MRGVSPTRAGVVVLLIEGLLKQPMMCLNDYIALHRLGQTKINLSDMYCYVSFLLLSHITGFSFEMTIYFLR